LTWRVTSWFIKPQYGPDRASSQLRTT